MGTSPGHSSHPSQTSPSDLAAIKTSPGHSSHPSQSSSQVLHVTADIVTWQCDCDQVTSDSTIVTRLVRTLTNTHLPLSVKDLAVMKLVQWLGCQARVFGCISAAHDRTTYLNNIGLTQGDQEILTFFSMYNK